MPTQCHMQRVGSWVASCCIILHHCGICRMKAGCAECADCKPKALMSLRRLVNLEMDVSGNGIGEKL